MALFKSKKKQAEELMASGAKGVGTVVSVQDTGMTVNDNPRVKMVFRVEPVDGSPAFDAEKKTTVSRVEIPRVGDRFPTWYDPADASSWAYATVNDDQGRAQIRQLFGAAAETMSGFGGGGAAAAPVADPAERLRKLEELRTAGLINDEEFAAKKAELLAGI